MPKVTVVTLPTNMVDTQQQVVEKKKRLQSVPLKNALHKGYTTLLSMAYGKDLSLNLLAFLLGRVSIMGEFAPVGLAFFAAMSQVEKKRAVTAGVWSIAGVLSGGNYYEAGIYTFTIGLYIFWASQFRVIHKKVFALPLFMFAAVLCGGLITVLFKDVTLYNVVLVPFEAGTCMVLSYIFMYGVPLLMGKQSTILPNNVTSERLSCMVMILATAVAGLGNSMVLEYSIRNMAGNLLIMAMALVGGASLSTLVGVIVGLIIGLTDGNATWAISLYALTGILAGVFRGFGKVAVIVGFILGSAITILYFGQDNQLIKVVSECLVSGSLFLLVPGKWIASWKEAVIQTGGQAMNHIPQLQEAAVKINHISEMFNDLSEAFGAIAADTKDKIRDTELAKTLSAVGEKVCVDCVNRPKCWEADFYRTYHGILEILEQAEIDSLLIHNMPNVFQENCMNRKGLLQEIKMVSERNRTLNFWQKKIVDYRQMVTEQMKAASVIISNLSYEIGKVENYDQELSLSLREKAATLGCPLTAVRVAGGQAANTVEVCKKPCNGNRECAKTILPLVTGVMKEKMTMKAVCGNEARSQQCKLMIKVAERFHIETGMASFAKDGQDICGDTCAVIPLNKGKIALVLSDGMGSGNHAAAESTMAINFLQKLLVAGFDTDVAVKTVNSMLLLRTPEESFVTIDMAIIDTYSGNAEFLKISSAPSFIKRVREVTTINSSSLPVGILQQIEIRPLKSTVVIGDFIVMVSDGIIDVPQSKLDKGNWLANFLRQSTTEDSQSLANRILAQARTMSGNRVSDDMTVLVAKIVESPTIL